MMGYTKIPLPSTVPTSVREFVEGPLDLYLRDAYDLIALPQPAVGIERGCGHQIVLTLTAVIAGLSRVFFWHHQRAKDAFLDALDYYPLKHEPQDSAFTPLTKHMFKGELYDVYRNNLAHGLGVALVPRVPSSSGWQLGTLTLATKIDHLHWLDEYGRHIRIPEPKRAELNDITRRPIWVPATVRRPTSPPRQLLSVEGLYWGLRVMTHAIACARGNDGDALLRPSPPVPLAGGRLAAAPTQVQSGTTPSVSATGTANTSNSLPSKKP